MICVQRKLNIGRAVEQAADSRVAVHLSILYMPRMERQRNAFVRKAALCLGHFGGHRAYALGRHEALGYAAYAYVVRTVQVRGAYLVIHARHYHVVIVLRAPAVKAVCLHLVRDELARHVRARPLQLNVAIAHTGNAPKGIAHARARLYKRFQAGNLQADVHFMPPYSHSDSVIHCARAFVNILRKKYVPVCNIGLTARGICVNIDL